MSTKVGFTEHEQNLWRWLISQGFMTVDTVFSESNTDRSTFFKAAEKYRHLILKADRRKFEDDDKTLMEVHRLRMDRMIKKRRKKKSVKALKIERQYQSIKIFRKEGKTWNDIMEYLKRYQRLRVSRGYFMKIWKQLEEQHKGDK